MSLKLEPGSWRDKHALLVGAHETDLAWDLVGDRMDASEATVRNWGNRRALEQPLFSRIRNELGRASFNFVNPVFSNRDVEEVLDTYEWPSQSLRNLQVDKARSVVLSGTIMSIGVPLGEAEVAEIIYERKRKVNSSNVGNGNEYVGRMFSRVVVPSGMRATVGEQMGRLSMVESGGGGTGSSSFSNLGKGE